MLAICQRYTSDRDVAQDILQDGFITVFEKIATYKGDGSFEGWVRRIMVNTALMHLRKTDALKLSDEITMADTQEYVRCDTLDSIQADDLLKLLREMPDGFRVVFNLYVMEGYSHAEIAKALNISEGASRSQLSRGRTWLKNRIKIENRYE
ncbi:MAG: sigma-70 family RNA polymerase sigma factor [Bacteroidales bacterium]|nr:sigma-70 family RNA polymerase sigma factor [Bacteroidales bacterium]